MQHHQMLQSPSGGTQAKAKVNIVNYQFLFYKICPAYIFVFNVRELEAQCPICIGTFPVSEVELPCQLLWRKVMVIVTHIKA